MVLAHAGSGPNGLRIAYILNLNGNKNKSQPKLSHGTGSLQTMEIRALLSVPSAWGKKKGQLQVAEVEFPSRLAGALPLPCSRGLTGEGSPCSGADRTGVVWLPGWIRTAPSLTSHRLLINALMNCLLIPIIILIFWGWAGFQGCTACPRPHKKLVAVPRKKPGCHDCWAGPNCSPFGKTSYAPFPSLQQMRSVRWSTFFFFSFCLTARLQQSV